MAGSTVEHDLTVGEVVRRSGHAASALRFYERRGLITSRRTSGNQRRYHRDVLRRLAFVRAARHIGLSLEEIRSLLDDLPEGRTPNRNDWHRISRHWRTRLQDEIDSLTALRDGLDSCIGCGCLSLSRCTVMNAGDRLAADGSGARLLPAALRTPLPGGG